MNFLTPEECQELNMMMAGHHVDLTIPERLYVNGSLAMKLRELVNDSLEHAKRKAPGGPERPDDIDLSPDTPQGREVTLN